MTQRQVKLDEYIIEQAEARGFPSPNQFIHYLMKFEESKIDDVTKELRTELAASRKTMLHQTEEFRNLTNSIRFLANKYDIELKLTDSERNFLAQMMKLDGISLDDIEDEAWKKANDE